MISKKSSLEEILAHVWEMLQRGSTEKDHPYRYPSLATYGHEGIQQRTVALRQAEMDQRKLLCYSDIRTQKAEDIRQQAQAHWLFYDHHSREQIRASSHMLLHHADKEAGNIWKRIPPEGRADYIGPVAPGTPSALYTPNLPADFLQQPSEENTAQGLDNFCLLSGEVYRIDFLKLMKKGHLRAQFLWKGKQWEKQWAAP